MRAGWLLVVVVATGCQGTTPRAALPDVRTARTPVPVATHAAPGTQGPAARQIAVPPIVLRYRVARHTTDAATASFAATVQAVLSDRHGWVRAGFQLVRDEHGPYQVVIGEADEVQRLCEPYDVYRTYSCQNGPVVAINADRWRQATPKWTGTLAGYQVMLINHEVGHLLGMHHPVDPQCPHPGQLARVMSQESTALNGCRPNSWPLSSEIARAGRHDLPLAPPAA